MLAVLLTKQILYMSMVVQVTLCSSTLVTTMGGGKWIAYNRFGWDIRNRRSNRQWHTSCCGQRAMWNNCRVQAGQVVGHGHWREMPLRWPVGRQPLDSCPPKRNVYDIHLQRQQIEVGRQDIHQIKTTSMKKFYLFAIVFFSLCSKAQHSQNVYATDDSPIAGS